MTAPGEYLDAAARHRASHPHAAQILEGFAALLLAGVPRSEALTVISDWAIREQHRRAVAA